MRSRRSGTRRWSAAALVVGLTLTVVPGAAARPTSDEVRGDLGRAEQRLDEIDEELSLAVELYNTAQVALDEVTGQLAATRAELGTLRDERSRRPRLLLLADQPRGDVHRQRPGRRGPQQRQPRPHPQRRSDPSRHRRLRPTVSAA